jgi:hypothetical protein
MYSNSNMNKKKTSIFTFGLIIVLVVAMSVYYLVDRSSKSPEKDVETGDLPTVKDAGIELVLNPADAADKVEEYSIFTREYAFGDTTAKNIDVKLKWTNGPTFVSVNSLIFVHKANGNKVRENITTTNNVTSNATNELIFKGEQLTSEDIVGDNTIDMYWNKIDDKTNKLTTISFKITQEHLDTTLNLANASTIDIPVQLSSTSKASGDVIATHTKYRILPFFRERVHIRKTSANDKGFHVIKGDQKLTIDDVDTFYIVKALGKDFISKDASGNNILRGDTEKFVTKNEIFGDVDIMDSSAINLIVYEQLEKIPHQIASSTDDWCWHDGKTVHQDVPGCGRICSSATHVGRKDKDNWGTWVDNKDNIDCPDAELDEIWEVQADGSRKLVVGKPSKAFYEDCGYYVIQSRYDYYLKDIGDGVLRADERLNIPGIKGWTFERTDSDTYKYKIKGPEGYYLKDMDLNDGAIRLDKRSWAASKWNISGTQTKLNIISDSGNYLCMNNTGKIFIHGSNIPESNAWSVECV